MPKSKMWQPVALDDLPAALRHALQNANAQGKRNWSVCKSIIVTMPNGSPAEIARLREMVRVLNKQLERYRNGQSPLYKQKSASEIYEEVKTSVSRGQVLRVAAGEWPRYRAALLTVAEFFAANSQPTLRNIAMSEVRRLDRNFNYQEKTPHE